MSACLSATQRQVLGDLAAGGYLLYEEMPGTVAPYWVVPDPSQVLDYRITAADFAAVQPYISADERIETRVRYRITAAGQRALAALQEAQA